MSNKKPTIEELEALLDRDDLDIEIQPNGEIRAVDIKELVTNQKDRIAALEAERLALARLVINISKWIEGDFLAVPTDLKEEEEAVFKLAQSIAQFEQG